MKPTMTLRDCWRGKLLFDTSVGPSAYALARNCHRWYVRQAQRLRSKHCWFQSYKQPLLKSSRFAASKMIEYQKWYGQNVPSHLDTGDVSFCNLSVF
jgi:hypothetical protein